MENLKDKIYTKKLMPTQEELSMIKVNDQICDEVYNMVVIHDLRNTIFLDMMSQLGIDYN